MKKLEIRGEVKMEKIKMVRYIRTIYGVMESTLMVKKSKVNKYLKHGYQVCDESKKRFMTVLDIIRE